MFAVMYYRIQKKVEHNVGQCLTVEGRCFCLNSVDLLNAYIQILNVITLGQAVYEKNN